MGYIVTFFRGRVRVRHGIGLKDLERLNLFDMIDVVDNRTSRDISEGEYSSTLCVIK